MSQVADDIKAKYIILFVGPLSVVRPSVYFRS